MSPARPRPEPEPPDASWTFLTNHAHVLIAIAADREARIRDLAVAVGITERAVQRIIRDLADAGYLELSREGRRNSYRVRRRLPLRHALERHNKVDAILALAPLPAREG